MIFDFPKLDTTTNHIQRNLNNWHLSLSSDRDNFKLYSNDMCGRWSNNLSKSTEFNKPPVYLFTKRNYIFFFK